MSNHFHDLIKSNPELEFDPWIQSQLRREDRINENKEMHTMLQYPAKTGWIKLLDNRVALQSVGNIRYGTRVFYNAVTRKIGSNPKECTIPFRLAKLKNSKKAQGWIYI